MKRRHYRIHYNEPTQQMRRKRRSDAPWGTVLLIAAALLITAVGVYAVVRWIGVHGAVE